MNAFKYGFQRMLPITTGVFPFGLVMGTVAAEAKLSLLDSVLMNLFVYAGTSQLAAVDLMTKHAPVLVVVATGLIINVRLLLYSAALAPVVQKEGFWRKLLAGYWTTDQGYAVMSAHESELPTRADQVSFYFGSALCMALAWHLSVLAGYLFGNFAPRSWSLDFAVPLSFVVLLIPTLKSRTYLAVAVFSGAMSLALKPLPYNLGLIVSALLAMGLAAALTRKRAVA